MGRIRNQLVFVWDQFGQKELGRILRDEKWDESGDTITEEELGKMRC
jgi:hypothetical protein